MLSTVSTTTDFVKGALIAHFVAMGHFAHQKVLINAFLDSSNAMLVTAVVLKFSESDKFTSCRIFGTLSEC